MGGWCSGVGWWLLCFVSFVVSYGMLIVGCWLGLLFFVFGCVVRVCGFVWCFCFWFGVLLVLMVLLRLRCFVWFV